MKPEELVLTCKSGILEIQSIITITEFVLNFYNSQFWEKETSGNILSMLEKPIMINKAYSKL